METFSPYSLECEVYQKRKNCACTILGAPSGDRCRNYYSFQIEAEGNEAGGGLGL